MGIFSRRDVAKEAVGSKLSEVSIRPETAR